MSCPSTQDDLCSDEHPQARRSLPFFTTVLALAGTLWLFVMQDAGDMEMPKQLWNSMSCQ